MTKHGFAILPLALLAAPALAVQPLPNSLPPSVQAMTAGANDIAPAGTAFDQGLEPIAANLPAPVDRTDPVPVNIIAATAPEPAAWALMIAGFGLVGWAVRRHRASRFAGA